MKYLVMLTGMGRQTVISPDATRSLVKIHPVWEAGERLALKSAINRKIKTFIDKDGDGTVDSGEFINFIPGNSSMLRPYLRAIDDREAADIIKYIRGEEITSYRKRKVTLSGVREREYGNWETLSIQLPLYPNIPWKTTTLFMGMLPTGLSIKGGVIDHLLYLPAPMME